MGKAVEKVVAELLSSEAKEEGCWAWDISEAEQDGQPLMQRPSWLTELMQPGEMAT